MWLSSLCVCVPPQLRRDIKKSFFSLHVTSNLFKWILILWYTSSGTVFGSCSWFAKKILSNWMFWCSWLSVKHIFSCVFAYNFIISCCASERVLFVLQMQIKTRLKSSWLLLFFLLNTSSLGFENVWGFQVIPITFTVFLYNCRREYYIKLRHNRAKDFASFS